MRTRARLDGLRLRACGLFSGSGGFELGLRRAGHSIGMLSEIDPHAISVLRARFPDSRLHGDIRELRDVGCVDLVAAGFPCQDLSQVGLQHGIQGVRSGLVAEVFRLLRKRAVGWVLLENVSYLRVLHGGAGLRWLLEQFEELGYRWAYRTIDSRAFGVPQRRRRVFLLASRIGDPRSVLLSPDKGEPDDRARSAAQSYGFYWTEGNTGLGWVVDGIPTLKGVSSIGIVSPPAIIRPSGRIVVPDIRDAERLQGFPSNWTKPAEELDDRRGVRWRLVGNAVTVNVAQWIGERLASVRRPYIARDERDIPFEARALRMPAAAWSVGGGQWVEARVSSWPVHRSSSLEKFLKHEGKPLSLRATMGFYRRLLRSQLNKPAPLISALEKHIRWHQEYLDGAE